MNTSIWPDTAVVQAAARPPWWRGWLCKPDALSVMQQQLADAQRDLAGHAALTEYHSAMRDMLRERCVRLIEELRNA